MNGVVECERLLNLNVKESLKFVDNGGRRYSNNSQNQVEKDDLYTQLWRACAGRHVNVPRVGDKVFYFPQGHIEQVKAYTNEDEDMAMPIYNVPSKILCKVVYVQLKAEAQTDEVFAQVTLLPEAKQDWQMLEDDISTTLPQRTQARYFSKTLTASDTSTHGGLSVPKRHADECLPPLDMSQQPPVQELVAKDLHGIEWHFRHIYRGQPRRHLLTSGWSSFVTLKKLLAGDACIFLRCTSLPVSKYAQFKKLDVICRKGENGELHVGIRRASLQHNASKSVISGHSMQHGILASAFHAISTGSMFTVYYRPWTTPSEFMISYDRYVKSIKKVWSIGSRLQMQFEAEDAAEHGCAGTVVDIEDLDCVRWPKSEWRCLKVQWDTASERLGRPERVSHWDIEHTEPEPRNKHRSVQPPAKRARALESSSPGFSILARDGLFQGSLERTPQGVLQGQENRVTGACKSSTLKRPLSPHLVLPPIADPGCSQVGLMNQQQVPTHDPFYRYPGDTISSPDGVTENSRPPGYRPSLFGACGSIGVNSNLFALNVDSSSSGSQDKRASEEKDEIDDPVPQSNGNCNIMLFGVNLVNNLAELPSPQVATSVELQGPIPPITSQSSSETVYVSKPSKSVASILPEKQCKKCCSVTNRSCTKVLKFGTALGRSVDLTRFDGYGKLICDLDKMFDFEGKLIDGSCGWCVTYMDDEGDMMLIGDYPWQEFTTMVRRMFICPREHINRPNASN